LAFTSVFEELAALLVLASIVGGIGALLRQPLIVSFIVAGLVAGPNGLGIVQASDTIAIFAELGVALLLFLVGLKLDLHLVRSLAGVALATGLGQVLFTSLVGFLICLALGMDPVTALYVAVALTFSSTIIIIKLLSDKREVDALHGRIALGFLIVQDLVVVLAMMAVSALAIGDLRDTPGNPLIQSALGLALFTAIGLFARYGAERLLNALSRAPDLLVSFAIGWAALLAAVFDEIGFSKEMGGLLAGVAFASTSLREAISSRLSVVRDFLLLFFFVNLGAQFDLSTVGESWPGAVILSLFVLIGNPLIVLLIMGLMGYRKRTGFLAGLTVAQISEFSLIFMAMGVTLGHVEQSALGLVTLVGLVTIASSTYMIVYSHRLYAWLERWLTPFDRLSRRPRMDAEEQPRTRNYNVIVYGLGRLGSEIAWNLHAKGLSVLGLDTNPDILATHYSRGLSAHFGDASDPDFPALLPLARAQWVVIALPDYADGPGASDPRPGLIRGLREHGFAGHIAVAAHSAAEAERLGRIPNIVILRPFVDAARQASERILASMPGDSEGT
jgi:Kef-type K+ transport system membrane component KefB